MKKASVSTKKSATKTRARTNSAHEVHAQRFTFSIKEGDTPIGTVTLELALGDAPKTCDVYIGNVPSANGNDRNRSKQGCYKDCPLRRLTLEGIQSGEVFPAAKPIAVSDLENEIGVLSHGVGTISLCRSSSGFDSSQFFVCFTSDEAEVEYLNSNYPVFGRVVDGLDLLLALRAKVRSYVQEDGKIDSGCPITFTDFGTAQLDGSARM